MRNPFGPGRPRMWSEADGMSRLPRSPGAYRFVNVQSRVIEYIGITANLYGRMSNHRSTQKKYDPVLHRVEYQLADSDHEWSQLCAWEVGKIKRHDPSRNHTVGGNGRFSKRYHTGAGENVKLATVQSMEDAAGRSGRLGRILGIFRR
jgi:excinuclease UvrABC nuclease subunit